MFKRYLAPHFIRPRKQHYFIKSICLLAVLLGTQTVAVQLQITQYVYANPQQQTVVARIPDPNLRTAIAEELGKNPNDPITVQEMEGLRRLDARDRAIQDLTGLQFASNLGWLNLKDNQVSGLSPLAGLIELRELWLEDNLVSDISPVRRLINLTHLEFAHNPVSDMSPVRDLTNLTFIDLNETLVFDISPVRSLINLTHLEFDHTPVPDISVVRNLTNLTYLEFDDTLVSDLSPLAGLINLEILGFSNKNLSDISPLAGLINLKNVFCWGHAISDLSPLAGLTKLEIINFCGGNISDLSPLVGLPKLKELYIAGEKVSDISVLAGLTGLTRLGLEGNDISDISSLAGLTNLKWLRLDSNDISNVSPLAGLINLTWLAVNRNNIADLSPLDGIRENLTTLLWHDNPAFPKGGPKIEGPWLWVLVPDREIDSSTDLLSEASDGAVTEMEVSTHGATEGKSVGDSVWTSHRLPPSGHDNIGRMLKESIRDGVLYGTVPLHSPRQQETTIYVGSEDESKVWLNGVLIYENFRRRDGDNYTDFFSVTLKQGINVLLVAVEIIGNNGDVFLGFEPGTEYTAANAGISYTFSKTPIHTGDTFTLDIGARDFFDLAGWQLDIAFDPAILEAINVSEGNFLKMGGANTFFRTGTINNATGKITGFTAARTSTGGISGTDTLLQVTFKAKARGETALALQNVEFGNPTGALISAGPHGIRIIVGGQLATGDVNRDGVVTILDLILIARQLGQRVSTNSPADLNGDGSISILDLILAARSLGSTTAPAAPSLGTASVDAATIEAWIAQARLEDDGSLAFKQGIEFLEQLLSSLIPEETALLRNYPNPFNPETWIPYQLAQATDVTLTIYDAKGVLVHQLDIGYQQAGHYIDRTRAAYWDGCNHLGESVGSGIYFYQLRAGDYSTARKMLILK